jgi:hypothetical protein
MNAKQILIYDEDCPFCTWYTGMFVRFHFLNENERIPYDKAIRTHGLRFDHEIASNKIALLYPETDNVKYGIDSLLTVIGSKIKWIEVIGKLPLIKQMLILLYSLISYNRKIIAPSSCGTEGVCQPSKSIFWRIVFIVMIALFINYATGIYFTAHLTSFYRDTQNLDLLFFSAQFLFQFIVFKGLKQHNFFDYAGNLAMVGLKGGLCLLFFHFGIEFLDQFNVEIKMLEPLCFGIVLAFMFVDHKAKIAQRWTVKLSYTWLCYRLIIYPVAFYI